MKFAFVIHPMKAKDAARKYPVLGVLPDPWIETLMTKLQPKIAGKVSGIVADDGSETEGIFIGLPLTPRQFLELPEEFVYQKIIDCCKLAKEEGCEIIGLGAFSSVVGDGGITVAKNTDIAVTTGNSYTVATAIEGSLTACELVGIQPEISTLAVVGATGSIGKTCATILSKKFQNTVLVGRDLARTQELAQSIRNASGTTNIADIASADLVVTVTSSDAALILPQHLKVGAVVCDVARPRDVSARVSKERPDVLVIEGGVVSVPGNVHFEFDFGFPPRTAYACMSETMMLALEERAENFTLGKDVSVSQVEETWEMAKRLGFKLSGFRSFEKAVSEEAIQQVIKAREARYSMAASHE